MPAVVFIAPFLLEATVRFVAAVAALPDARVGLISQDPEERLPEDVRRALDGHYRVANGMDPAQLADAVRAFQRHFGQVDGLIATLEQLQVPLAQVRSWCGIGGLSIEAAQNFRDKSRMKDVLRAHSIPCARHVLARSGDEAAAGAEQLGLPLVVKPPAGAGARATFRVDEPQQLLSWLRYDPPSDASPALLEEVMTGDEHSFDSVMLGRSVAWRSISRYLPAPLDVVRNPWIQWAVLLPRDISTPQYARIDRVAAEALRVLGLHDGLTHMEWFLRENGDVAISEVAARPPGAQFMTLMSFAHDCDMYRAWAELEVFGRFPMPERRHAVGAVYLRGQGRGVVRELHGFDTLQHELGELVVAARLPHSGQPASDSYEGEGYVILRHDDTSVVEAALRRVADVARVVLAE